MSRIWEKIAAEAGFVKIAGYSIFDIIDLPIEELQIYLKNNIINMKLKLQVNNFRN